MQAMPENDLMIFIRKGGAFARRVKRRPTKSNN
jgi:hypothetical protein